MFSLSTGLRNGMLNATGWKEAFANGRILLYTGAMPTDADQAVGSATLLGSVTHNGVAFVAGSGANGVTFDAPASGVVSKAAAETWQYTGLADGTVGWCRLVGNPTDAGAASTTLPRFDVSVAASGTGVIVFATTTIVTGAPGIIQAFAFTLPVR